MSRTSSSSPVLAQRARRPRGPSRRARSRASRLDELVHHGEALEGVLAVEDARARRTRRTPCRPGRAARRPNLRLIAAPPISTGYSRPCACSSWIASGICLEVETSSADRPIAVASCSLAASRIVADRHLLAEVDDRVAVVGEDRVDERLADVVHVAEHGREHDGALRVALELVEVLLELGDGALHDLGALEHERQDQLAGAELVADLLHGRQQHVVERRDGADLLDASASIWASTPSFLRRRMCQCSASSGSMPAVGSAASASASPGPWTRSAR